MDLLPQQGGGPHLPEVPHFYVNNPKNILWSHRWSSSKTIGPFQLGHVTTIFLKIEL